MATSSDMGVLFREVQYFRQPWLRLLVFGVSGLTLYAAVQLLIPDKPFGSNPGSDTLLMVLLVVFGLGFPVFFHRLNLTTEVRSDGLYYRFFPFHLSVQRISLEDLKSFEVRTYRPIREYGGWGVKTWGASGKAYNVAGNRGVQLELVSGKRILIGSQRADELAEALALAAGQRGVSRL